MMLLLGARLPGVGTIPSSSRILLRGCLSRRNSDKTVHFGTTPPKQEIPVISERGPQASHDESPQLDEGTGAGPRISRYSMPEPYGTTRPKIRQFDGKAPPKVTFPKAGWSISRTRSRSTTGAPRVTSAPPPPPPPQSSEIGEVGSAISQLLKNLSTDFVKLVLPSITNQFSKGVAAHLKASQSSPRQEEVPDYPKVARLNRKPGNSKPLPPYHVTDRDAEHLEQALNSSALSSRKAHTLDWVPGVDAALRNPQIIQISKEVGDGLKCLDPVVALETTIYTHGFPYPDNVALALDLEAIVRKNGGIPATIGIIDGIACVGMNEKQLRTLASSAGKPETMKVSRRDLPYILGMGIAGRKLNGGTTISGTMCLAHQVGIKVFGTGGLGGVHRGGQDTMDISADLTELGRTSVAVISSGCKSFLDLPRTLEYLETQGAGVFTFADGRTGAIDFPSFYTRDSGVKGPQIVQNAMEAASIIFSQSVLRRNVRSGLLFGNPIPEEFSIPKEEIDLAINQAVQEAADQGIHGHANTPFILARIKELTEGRSIPANRALIESNVAMATKVAVELSKLRRHGRRAVQGIGTTNPWNSAHIETTTSLSSSPPASSAGQISQDFDNNDNINVLVFGSLAIDFSCDYFPAYDGGERPVEKRSSPLILEDLGLSMNQNRVPDLPYQERYPKNGTSNPAVIDSTLGGVGHNVALAIHRVGAEPTSVRLCSFVGDDYAGQSVMSLLANEGMDGRNVFTQRDDEEMSTPILRSGQIRPTSKRTAKYVAVNSTGKDLVVAMADMKIFDATTLSPFQNMIEDPPNLKWVVVDANWNRNTAKAIMKRYSAKGAKVAFEPVSVAKCANLFKPSSSARLNSLLNLGVFPKHTIDLATPNQHELEAMHTSAKNNGYFESDQWWKAVDAMGIPSSGARDRFVSITDHHVTDTGIPIQSVQLLPLIPTILTKLGPDGVLLTELLKPNDPRLTDPDHAPYILSRCSNGDTSVGGVYMRLFPSVEQVHEIVSVNGAGDTFLGVLIAGLAKDIPLGEELINLAQEGAIWTLKSPQSVSPLLSNLRKPLLEMAARAVVDKEGPGPDERAPSIIDGLEYEEGEEDIDDDEVPEETQESEEAQESEESQEFEEAQESEEVQKSDEVHPEL